LQQQREQPGFARKLIPLIALLLVTQPALAMRCGTKLVLRGDHQAKVLNQCGDPTLVNSRTIFRAGPTRQQLRSSLSNGNASISDSREVYFYQRSFEEVLIEEWTYNLGPNRLMRVIRFENGYVSKIDALGYGYVD